MMWLNWNLDLVHNEVYFPVLNSSTLGGFHWRFVWIPKFGLMLHRNADYEDLELEAFPVFVNIFTAVAHWTVLTTVAFKMHGTGFL